MLETFYTRKDRYIFLLNVYFFKIKNEHRNVKLFFVSHFSDNVMRTFYKLAVTMQDNVVLVHD